MGEALTEEAVCRDATAVIGANAGSPKIAFVGLINVPNRTDTLPVVRLLVRVLRKLLTPCGEVRPCSVT